MTEQKTIQAPDEAGTTTREDEPATKSTSPKKTIATAPKKDTKKSSSLTDDQKRLARNAALREWRKKNADRVKAYMTEWRAKRKEMEPESVTEEAPRSATKKGAGKATKKSTSKKSKKSPGEGKA